MTEPSTQVQTIHPASQDLPAAPARSRSVRQTAGDVFRQIYELSGNQVRLVPMEGLRGLAVLLVFFVHFDALFSVYLVRSSTLWKVSRFLGLVGNAGVDLFFVLSGYLIYSVLIRGKMPVSRFLSRRVQRIYPTFFAVFVFYLALSLLFPGASKLHGLNASHTVFYLVQNLLLLPGVFRIEPLITVAWSLSYEMFFYLSAALLIPTLLMRRWRQSSRVAFFTCFCLVYLGVSFTMRTSYVRALMFIAGIVMYEAFSNQRISKAFGKAGEVLAALGFLGSLVYAFLLDTHHNILAWLPWRWAGLDPTPGVAAYQGPYKTAAFLVSMFALIAYSCGFNGFLKRIFSWAPLRYLGNMSYSYYLIHGVTLQGVALVWSVMVPRRPIGVLGVLATLVVGFGATWVSSSVLFISVEKRFSLVHHPAKAIVSEMKLVVR